ncbi:MAG: Rieske (2Fe-2S) protein, partial [Micromonosporaceae bacterium]|nr:Rieske (2Fe-2S) protein [Micromonosporaceae bacterium]
CGRYGPGGGSGDGGPGGGPLPSRGAVLAQTSEIPVGGGKIFPDTQVVVTQPQAGTFKGFSAICTHQQCTVSEVSGGTIRCPCHGSQYNIADGSVAVGPAPRPLPPVNVTVKGTAVTLG